VRSLVAILGWGAAVCAGIAACSSDHHSAFWSMTTSVPAQPTITPP